MLGPVVQGTTTGVTRLAAARFAAHTRRDDLTRQRLYTGCVFGTAAGRAKRQFAQDAKEAGKAVVLSKRIPQDYVETTLLPHLESQLLDSIHVYTPAELAKIAKAYSVMEVRQRALCVKLAQTVKDRMPAFEAIDIVDILGAMWIMVPDDDDLFEVLEERILEKMNEFTALNFMGIIRIYNKRAEKHHDLLSKVLPRLRELLVQYEAVELSETLVSMAQVAEAERDMDILMVLVPEIERRYDEVALVHAINNIWALTQLKIVHQGLLQRVAKDVSIATKVKDLPPKYMARLAWVYRRCNAWEMVSKSMLELIHASSSEFSCGDFARLAQSLPQERLLLERVCESLRHGLVEMGRKDFMFFVLGCVHAELLEEARRPMEQPDSLVALCLKYIMEEQDSFSWEEVNKLVYMLWHAQKYRYLLDHLPASWISIKEETMDYIRARG